VEGQERLPLVPTTIIKAGEKRNSSARKTLERNRGGRGKEGKHRVKNEKEKKGNSRNRERSSPIGERCGDGSERKKGNPTFVRENKKRYIEREREELKSLHGNKGTVGFDRDLPCELIR